MNSLDYEFLSRQDLWEMSYYAHEDLYEDLEPFCNQFQDFISDMDL